MGKETVTFRVDSDKRDALDAIADAVVVGHQLLPGHGIRGPEHRAGEGELPDQRARAAGVATIVILTHPFEFFKRSGSRRQSRVFANLSINSPSTWRMVGHAFL